MCEDAENLVRIGSRASDFARPLDGLIDEVLIYSRALSQAEVEQNFNSEGLAVVSSKQKLAISWGEIKVSR
ncbi:MAG: LamG-like jellyroll fold domain-containing protein [Candidatus Poribacteria bacterium]